MKFSVALSVLGVFFVWASLSVVGCGGSSGSGTNFCDSPDAPISCGQGCLSDAYCGNGTHCTDGVCTANCLSSQQNCGENEVCSTSGRCEERDPGACDDLGHPDACGSECDDDTPCGTGTFCDQFECTASCILDEDCSNDYVCSIQGECEFDNSGCGDAIDVTPTREIPNIMLILDKSGSMAWDFAGCASDGTDGTTGASCTFQSMEVRWEAVLAALTGANGIVNTLAPIARLGVTAYGGATYTNPMELSPKPHCSSDADCMTGYRCNGSGRCDTVATCEPGTTEVPFPPNDLDLPGQASNISTVLDGITPGGSTPTAQTIQDVTDTLVMTPPAEGNIAYVLATDGEPNACYVDENASPIIDRSSAVFTDTTLEIDRAFDLSIPTFVIGVGGNIGDSNLHAMANAGAGVASGATVWSASSPAQLTSALEEVFYAQIPCTITLDHEIDVAQACQATVTLNGEELTCDNTTRGWQANSSTEIELLGTACTDWQHDSSPDLSISAPCEIVVG